MTAGRSRSSALLVGAAVVLAVVGLVLVFGGGGGDGDADRIAVADGPPRGATASDPPSPDAPDDARDPDGSGSPTAGEDVPDGGAGPSAGLSAEPLAPSDTPTAKPTPEPRQTPTLPPGMQLPEPVAVPDPATVDGTDPDAVTVAVLTAAYSFDTARDGSAEDAMLRAESWLAQEHGSSDYDLAGLRRDIDRDWERWVDHQAFAAISAVERHTSAGDRPDTATQAERRYFVRMTPVGRDAWNGSLIEHQWFVFLGRDSEADDWQVVELRNPLADR